MHYPNALLELHDVKLFSFLSLPAGKEVVQFVRPSLEQNSENTYFLKVCFQLYKIVRLDNTENSI